MAATLSDMPECKTSARIATSKSEVSDIDVFLGGSCNPTTWRHDFAIPRLEAARITYFNPQKDEWYEGLIEIERRAKEAARIMLIFIDNLTRATVSINEAVEHICRGRRIVLVVQDIEQDAIIEGDELTRTELDELNYARASLRNLVLTRQNHSRDALLFPDISSATEAICKLVNDGDLAGPVPDDPRLSKQSSPFASLVHGTTTSERGTTHVVNHLLLHAGCFKTPGSVYFGGYLDGTFWRDQTVLLQLQRADIGFQLLSSDYVSFGLAQTLERPLKLMSTNVTETKANDVSSSQLIFFVIPRHARCVVAMAEAVEMILSPSALLLVIEPLEEGFLAEGGHPVVGREFKDLARARAYLQETAELNGVPVFSSVSQAVERILEL